VNIASATLLAATPRSRSIGAVWWIVMAICMLFMVAMMLGTMWRGRGGWRGWGASPRWSYRWPGSREESPIDTLERRFAEDEISVEDYRERREALTNAARGRDGAGSNRCPVASQAIRQEEP
jgi:hypothetical protein